MLTENEKQILGYMVDAGQLRGEERIAAGASDSLARSLIETFKTQQRQVLPMQINSLQNQKLNVEADIATQNELLTLLEEKS